MTKMNCVGIFGTSGMAREAGDIARLLRLEPIFVARNESELNAWNYSAHVILEKDIDLYLDMPYVVGIGEASARKSLAERYRSQLSFTNLIHPSATFGASQREVIDNCEGTIIAAGARFTCDISVGNFCIFNQNATIAHDCVVGNFVHVAPGANVSGNVLVNDGCWIGAGSVINQGKDRKKLEIGRNAVIGSGAVVIEDCMPDAVYAGIPAKRIK